MADQRVRGTVIQRAGNRNGLCQKMVEAAKAYAESRHCIFETEHLGGGLYAKQGWTLVQVYDEGGVDHIVMVKNLAPHWD